jgi:hypothetical protein
MTVMRDKRCPGCYRRFTMTSGECRLYLTRTGHIPRLCLKCRLSRRKQIAVATVTKCPAPRLG